MIGTNVYEGDSACTRAICQVCTWVILGECGGGEMDSKSLVRK